MIGAFCPMVLVWYLLVSCCAVVNQDLTTEDRQSFEPSSLLQQVRETDSASQDVSDLRFDMGLSEDLPWLESVASDFQPALEDFRMERDDRPGSGIGSDFFSQDQDFANGLLIRSGDVAMKIGGFLKVDFIYDFNPIGNTDAFDVTTIEVGAPPRTNTRFHARQTRLNWDTRWDSDLGLIRMFIEGDFFFNQRESGQLGENRFRLRHAFAEVGKWMVGQNWTTLADIAASPQTLDFEGQVAAITTRRTQIRWTTDLADSDWTLALAIEDPFTIIEVPEGVMGEPRTQSPDAVIRLRWTKPNIQSQFGGVYRTLGYQPVGEPVFQADTWGLQFSQSAVLNDKAKFYTQLLWGIGIGSFRGTPDFAPTAAGVEEAIGTMAWMVGTTYDWTDRLSSNITYAENEATNDSIFEPDQLKRVKYFAGNLIYETSARTNVGIEYLYGLRQNFGGQSGGANRIQIAFTYYLP